MKSKDIESNYQELYSKTGIYKITCVANNKIYIGSACSTKATSKTKQGFFIRWISHLRKLRQNTHRNRYLQYAFNKYGEDSFEFEILEECNSREAIIKEDYYINLLKSHINENGFNILLGHLANYNHVSEETRQKLREKLKGVKRPLEVVKKWSNAVYQYDSNMNLIAEYYSMSEAERATGIMRQDIGQACIGKKMKRAGGFYWKKVKDIV